MRSCLSDRTRPSGVSDEKCPFELRVSGNGRSNPQDSTSTDDTDAGDEFDADFEPNTKLGEAEPISRESEPDREYSYLMEEDSVVVETGEIRPDADRSE